MFFCVLFLFANKPLFIARGHFICCLLWFSWINFYLLQLCLQHLVTYNLCSSFNILIPINQGRVLLIMLRIDTPLNLSSDVGGKKIYQFSSLQQNTNLAPERATCKTLFFFLLNFPPLYNVYENVSILCCSNIIYQIAPSH